MKRILSAFFAALLTWHTTAVELPAQSAGSFIAGHVIDNQGKPVSGVKISVRDRTGRVVGEAISGSRYSIPNLQPGHYQLTLDPLKAPYKGETVLASLPGEGLTVEWIVSANAPAVAMATPGAAPAPMTAGGFFAPGFLPFVLFTGTVLGTLYGTGVINDDPKTGSPSR
ncbi:MAG TPA: carboxypeptidase-like regulatory domain-containing protein [Candidatus Eisenbacteria bacterium]|nr:carboxypeptidase-like regulatory domain-containing protein [Candidatus Eisenbacteria bacterium]